MQWPCALTLRMNSSLQILHKYHAPCCIRRLRNIQNSLACVDVPVAAFSKPPRRTVILVSASISKPKRSSVHSQTKIHCRVVAVRTAYKSSNRSSNTMRLASSSFQFLVSGSSNFPFRGMMSFMAGIIPWPRLTLMRYGTLQTRARVNASSSCGLIWIT